MLFGDFVKRLVPLVEADPAFREALPPSTWKGLFETGASHGLGAVSFDAERLVAAGFDHGDSPDFARRLAETLNAEFASRGEAEVRNAGSDPSAGGSADGSDGSGTGAPSRSEPWTQSGGEQVRSAASAEQTASHASEAPGDEVPGDLSFPQYDYSREDLEPLSPVRIHVIDDGRRLQYSWDDPGQNEVFRVVTSDTEQPFSPDEGETVQTSLSPHAIDGELPTTAVRFVTVWAYERLDRSTWILGQPRCVAMSVHVHPPQDVAVEFVRAEQAVFARWTPPPLPARVTGRVVSAKIPAGESVGRYRQGQKWLGSRYAVTNNGHGFQDQDLEPGLRHSYLVATEVEIDGKTILSAPVTKEVTPVAEPDRIDDLEIEAITRDREEMLRLTWTQRRGTRVSFYRSHAGADAAAVSRGLIERRQLPDAGLPDELQIPNIPHRTGTSEDVRRETWVLEDLKWPRGHAWDSLHLIPVTEVDEKNVLIGRPVQRRRAGRVENITVLQRMNWQLVTFTWPGDAVAVELRIAHSQGEFDPRTPPSHTVEKQEYERSGGFRIDDGLPPSGCRLFLTAVTHFQGRRILSEPTVAAVEPLWGYSYDLQWPGRGSTGRQGFMTRAAKLLNRTLVEIQVRAVIGTCPEPEVPRLVLVHNAERLPLHAGDGTRVEMYLEKPGGQVAPSAVRAVPAPVSGQRSAWFDYASHGAGWYRILVDAPPASSVEPGQRRTALERYAVADPALPLLHVGER